MRILGIETSCDETAAAVVENGTKILSDVVASSAEMHIKTGGIIPEQAARQQVKLIIPVIQESLKEALNWSPKSASSPPPVDAIAVTAGGPGLIGSMLVGVETAKTLAYIWKKPIVPVVHLLAHSYANWLRNPPYPKFPAIVLTVAGGHTDLILMKNHGNSYWLGGTRDDAAGECFDKCARLLGLPYPGGSSISSAAEKFLNLHHASANLRLNLFPRPLIGEDNLDFSFSGLKTAVLRETDWLKKEKKEKLPQEKIPKLAAEIQEAVVNCLVEKSAIAIRKHKPKSFLLAGGVAANIRLREKLSRAVENMKRCAFHVAPARLCTDNATFIASYAYFNYEPLTWKKIKAIPDPIEASKVYGNLKNKLY